jgi:hypothetical protein
MSDRPVTEIPVQPPRAPTAKFAFAPGARPLAGYTIRCGVGRGGFGEVYSATSDGGKEVALKLIRRNLEVELRGVMHCLNIKHPHLLSIHDIKHDDEDNCWIVMEHVVGESLEQVLDRSPNGLSPPEALRWLCGIAAGVTHLHEHGIVHRDLKPGNIFDDGGHIKIGDYGLSKFISCSRRSGQTESIGTVHYMAPEVANGRYGKEIDIYALGVILYEMLTGRVPFEGESIGEVLMKHLTAEPDLSLLAEPYRDAVRRALAKDPAARFSSVNAMVEALSQPGAAASTAASQPVISKPATDSSAGDEEPIWRFVRTQWSAVTQSWQQAKLEAWQKLLMVILIGFALLMMTPIWMPLTALTLLLYGGYLIVWTLYIANRRFLATMPPSKASVFLSALGIGTVVLLLMATGNKNVLVFTAALSPLLVFGVVLFARRAFAPSQRPAWPPFSFTLALLPLLAVAFVAALLVKAPVSWALVAEVMLVSGAVFAAELISYVAQLLFGNAPAPRVATATKPTEKPINIAASVIAEGKRERHPMMSDDEWALFKARWHQPEILPSSVIGTVRERVTQLLGSLLVAAILSLLISFAMLLVRREPIQAEQFAWMALVSTLGAWGILISAKFLEGRVAEPIFRRLVMLVVGLVVGAAAYSIDVGLWVDLPFDNLSHVSAPKLRLPSRSFYDATDGSPLLYAYLAYFGFLFLLVPWWRYTDPLRSTQLRFRSIAVPLVIAFVLNLIWPFPQPWGLMVVATISSAAQLASPLVTNQMLERAQSET